MINLFCRDSKLVPDLKPHQVPNDSPYGITNAARITLTLVTALYVVFSFLWLGRQGVFQPEDALSPLRRIWFFVGLDQDWRLFGPEIRNFICHPSATVTYQDGTVRFWQLPQTIAQMKGDRFRQNKIRKWTIDSLPWQMYRGYWPELGRKIARQHASADFRPKSFTLYLNWSPLPTLDKQFLRRDQLPSHIYLQPIFQHEFAEEDFVEDR